ncbi:MAG: phosphatidate cytidylyltransferase [Burkholderiales bacterium]|nr:phosphatidate cytidylyltransferase [Burkholderiales bacterium]
MLRQRIVTALVLLPLAAAALFLLPSAAWGVVSGGVIVVAALEWAALSRRRGRWRIGLVGVLVIAMLALLALGADGARHATLLVVAKAACAAGLVFWLVVAVPWLWHTREETRGAVLFASGIAVLLPAWIAALVAQPTPLRLLALMAIVWIADTAAYFCGRAFGRHKLAPRVSPGKTWEGVAGAVVAVAAYAVALHAADVAWVADWSLVALVIAFVAICAISIVGDLHESWMKRAAGVKDSGRLLPGHGGVLDRIDALAPALPLAVLLFVLRDAPGAVR